jgi:hypothetical protein
LLKNREIFILKKRVGITTQKQRGRSAMLKEAGGLAGGALLFSPLGMPILLHGVAGVVVGGAGLFVADAVLKQVVVTINDMVVRPETEESGDKNAGE